ncbi:MAG TPA: sulfotransferase domain-containing protein [Aquaticitalea sp.]|nr:sulfotransferase domain-containing protein [Aquaticitalea sp.]
MVGKIKEAVRFIYRIAFARIKSNENILIYGISRGGTTLLAETLVEILDARFVWEPFFRYRKVPFERINPYSTHRYNKLQFSWSPYVDGEDHKEVNGYFDRLLGLKERNIRFYRHTNHSRFVDQKKTVFKFCFGNFLYPYIDQRYGCKSILLLRHPFAVAASALNFGSNYDWHKNNYDKWRYNDSKWGHGFFEQYNSKRHLINSAFTLIVFQAVSQYSFVLSKLNKHHTIVVYYEDMVIHPETIGGQLESLLGFPVDIEALKKSFSRESFSSSRGHTQSDAVAQLSKWKQHCSVEEIAQGLKIFEAFGFVRYSDDILPIKSS